MQKRIASLLAALVIATAVMLPSAATPVRAHDVQNDTHEMAQGDQMVSEQDEAQPVNAAGDPEWKYVPVRRYASADSSATSSANSSPNYFDGRLLTADDLKDE